MSAAASATPATPRIGMGCAKLGAFWQGRSLRDGAAALDIAVDGGISLLDTADCYSRGISERLIGNALRRHPGQPVTVMTKVGLIKTPAAVLAARRSAPNAPGIAGLRRGGTAATCFVPGYVRWAVEGSLRRLKVERLDVLLLHEPDVEALRHADFLPELNRLLDLGYIGAWGASVRNHEAAEAAVSLPGLSWLQVSVSAAHPRLPAALSTTIRPPGITVVGLAVLGDGTLLERSAALLPSAPPAARAARLATFAARVPGVDAVLLGMSGPEHVRSNLTALSAGVTDSELDALAALDENGPA